MQKLPHRVWGVAEWLSVYGTDGNRAVAFTTSASQRYRTSMTDVSTDVGISFGGAASILPVEYGDLENQCWDAMKLFWHHVAAQHLTKTLDVGFSFDLSPVCMWTCMSPPPHLPFTPLVCFCRLALCPHLCRWICSRWSWLNFCVHLISDVHTVGVFDVGGQRRACYLRTRPTGECLPVINPPSDPFMLLCHSCVT